MLKIYLEEGALVFEEKGKPKISIIKNPLPDAVGDIVNFNFTSAGVVYRNKLKYTDIEVDGLVRDSANETISEINKLCSVFNNSGCPGGGITTYEVAAMIEKHNKDNSAHPDIRKLIQEIGETTGISEKRVIELIQEYAPSSSGNILTVDDMIPNIALGVEGDICFTPYGIYKKKMVLSKLLWKRFYKYHIDDKNIPYMDDDELAFQKNVVTLEIKEF